MKFTKKTVFMLSCHGEPHFAAQKSAKNVFRMILGDLGRSLGEALGTHLDNFLIFFEGMIFHAFLMNFGQGPAAGEGSVESEESAENVADPITPCSPFGSAANKNGPRPCR